MVIVAENLARLAALPVSVAPVLCPKLTGASFHEAANGILSLLATESEHGPRPMSALRVGVVLAASSCCASGVNNAVSGICAYLEESGVDFKLFGIVGGPNASSVLAIESSAQVLQFNNLGGTELLGYSSFSRVNGGSFDKIVATCVNLRLTSLVVIAASDELEETAKLAALLHETAGICVNVIPQSRNEHVFVPPSICSTSLGFDSARRVLAELAGNIAVDCISSKKYWHFINCGDAALVGEVALLIRANIVVSEHDPSVSPQEWIDRVADLIVERSVTHGLRSGVVMVSQCAFSRSTQMLQLRSELDAIDPCPIPEHVARKKLSPQSYSLLRLLPQETRSDLLRKKKLSYFSPEEFLVDELKAKLGTEFLAACRPHFLAHESRCPVPTAFDCVLGSSLGRTAAALVLSRHGYMAAMHVGPQWTPCAIPIALHGVLTQQGYKFSPFVAAALKALLPVWQFESRYRAFGPLQLPTDCIDATATDFVPFSVCGSLANVFAQIENPHKDTPHARILSNTAPPIRLPMRSVGDMAPLERDRLKYLPKIPAYFCEPYVCIDGPVGPQACTDDVLLSAVFPNSRFTLPVDIVLTIGGLTSDIAERNEDSCVSSQLNSSVLSPRNSGRILPPLTSKLIRPATSWRQDLTKSISLASVSSSVELLQRKSSPFRSEPIPSSSKRLQKFLSNPSPGKVGIVFLCSQVPGCHNVVSGLFDYLAASCSLVGFLGGATGLKNAWYHELTPPMIDTYRNQGGQDLLGHFGESLETEQDFADALLTIETVGLTALVVVGNLEGQLTAALLNERLTGCLLISVAASAENEMPFLRQSIGCDTVSRVFSNAIANLFTEAQSSRHRWYFVKLMSHHVSHLALECAMLTHPNIVLVTEEIALRKQSVKAITDMIADCIEKRANAGKEYGIVLIPDGVVAAIPEIRTLLRELDCITKKSLGSTKKSTMPIAMRLELVQAQLSQFSCDIFKQLPRFVQGHLVNDNTRHPETGKIDIANVASERILQYLVLEELRRRPLFSGEIEILVHSLAHQGRSSLPTDFDCDLAYTCGYAAGILLDAGRTGLVTSVTPQSSDCGWAVGGIPLVSLVSITPDQVSIEPTKLVMRGTRCSILTDALPRPELRQGHQPGPYQFGICAGIEKTMASSDASWLAFQRIVDDCHRLLEGQGSTLVVETIQHTLKMVEAIELRKKGTIDIGETLEPDDILSTCTPHRAVR